ncbi:MAG: tetratricopeptide repeat protein, partial [Candidatus Omnitrophota bacterium]
KKTTIDKLYKEAIANFDDEKLDSAKNYFNQIITLDPKQAKAREYLDKKIPKRSAELEAAQKKAEEERLKKETELKKQQDIASGKIEMERLREEKQALEGKAKELEKLKDILKNLTLAQEDMRQQMQGIRRERDELKAKSNLTGSEIAKLKDLNDQLEAKAKELFIKTQDFQKMKEDVEGLGKAMEAMNKERVRLQKRNKELEAKSGKASAIDAEVYQELGTAYTKAKIYDKAIIAYNKALSLNKNNAQVHYYLGLLYKHVNNDRKKAIYHLKRYLQLADLVPKERRKIEYLIEMMQEAPKHEITPSFKN